MCIKNRKTILLVEYDDISRFDRETALEHYGYNIMPAGSGVEALEILKNIDFIDLILLDIDSVNGVDGPETAVWLLKDNVTPAIFLLSQINPVIFEKTEKLISYGYVVKDSDNTLLNASIKMAFNLFYKQQKTYEDALRTGSIAAAQPVINMVNCNAGFSPDVTEKKELHDQLFNNYKMQNIILDTLDETVWGLRLSDNKYVYINKAVEILYGYPLSAWENNSDMWKNCIHPEDISVIEQISADLEKTGCSNHEYRIITSNNKTKWISSEVRLLVDENNIPYMLTGIGTDITTRKIAEDELKQAYAEMESRITARTEELQKLNEALRLDIIERRLTEDALRESEEKIKALLHEKKILLQEVHHRIKNNMNTIKGILFLQSEQLDDPVAINALNDARSRVQSMMVLYDRLFCSEDFKALSLKEYLSGLIFEIVNNFPNKEIVRIDNRIEDIIIDSKILVPIGIIINELITNTMKYAFAGKDSGLINIYTSMNSGSVDLVIRDNGIGIPPSFGLENSTGFGMQLVSMLTEQIGGKIRFEREEGSKFIITFYL